MTITDLAARDAAERVELRARAVAAVRFQIAQRRSLHARTDALEAHLAQLLTGGVS